MKNDVINLLKKFKTIDPYFEGKCRYCTGSQDSNHYPECIINDVDRVIEKYKIEIPKKETPKKAKLKVAKDED